MEYFDTDGQEHEAQCHIGFSGTPVIVGNEPCFDESSVFLDRTKVQPVQLDGLMDSAKTNADKAKQVFKFLKNPVQSR